MTQAWCSEHGIEKHPKCGTCGDAETIDSLRARVAELERERDGLKEELSACEAARATYKNGTIYDRTQLRSQLAASRAENARLTAALSLNKQMKCRCGKKDVDGNQIALCELCVKQRLALSSPGPELEVIREAQRALKAILGSFAVPLYTPMTEKQIMVARREYDVDHASKALTRLNETFWEFRMNAR